MMNEDTKSDFLAVLSVKCCCQAAIMEPITSRKEAYHPIGIPQNISKVSKITTRGEL